MPRLADFLSPDVVKQINLQFFDEGDYLRRGPFGLDFPSDTRKRIVRMRRRKIERPIEATEHFAVESLAEAWAQYMAYAVGTHIWPDANHRTAMKAFSFAAADAFGLDLGLPPDVGEDLVRRSKAVRDPEREATGTFYTIDELRDAAHPYRTTYRAFAPRLIIVEI